MTPCVTLLLLFAIEPLVSLGSTVPMRNSTQTPITQPDVTKPASFWNYMETALMIAGPVLGLMVCLTCVCLCYSYRRNKAAVGAAAMETPVGGIDSVSSRGPTPLDEMSSSQSINESKSTDEILSKTIDQPVNRNDGATSPPRTVEDKDTGIHEQDTVEASLQKMNDKKRQLKRFGPNTRAERTQPENVKAKGNGGLVSTSSESPPSKTVLEDETLDDIPDLVNMEFVDQV